MNHPLLRTIIVITLLAVSALIAIWPQLSSNQNNSPTNSISINDHQFSVTVARTPQQQVDGLGGWTRLDPNHGMYFPLNGRNASFWMKGMLIDIDIIWIKNGQVAGIHKNTPAPDSDTPDHQLKSYSSPISSPDGVLEIAAGRADELGIEVGDQVELSFKLAR